MRRSLRVVASAVALLAVAMSAVPAATPAKVTICLHTNGGNVQLEVSETAAIKLWELGLATFGPCGP